MRRLTSRFLGSSIGKALNLGAHDTDHLAPKRFNPFGRRSTIRLLKAILDAVYWLMVLVTVILLASIVASLFLPIDNLNITISNDGEGRQIPLSRPLLVFGLSAVSAYFGCFALILKSLRKIIRSLTLGNPFENANVHRLRGIGILLSIVTAGVWIGQALVLHYLAPGSMEPQGIKDLLTPAFSILIVFVLSEIFREGARLRRESELTI